MWWWNMYLLFCFPFFRCLVNWMFKVCFRLLHPVLAAVESHCCIQAALLWCSGFGCSSLCRFSTIDCDLGEGELDYHFVPSPCWRDKLDNRVLLSAVMKHNANNIGGLCQKISFVPTSLRKNRLQFSPQSKVGETFMPQGLYWLWDVFPQ